MKFIQFLIEQQSAKSQHQLAYQSMLSSLDDAHVSKRNDGWQFNFGTVSGSSKYRNLDIRLFKTEYDGTVKLGKMKDSDKFVIAVGSKEIPDRLKIDSFFDDNDIMNDVLKCLEDFSKLDNSESNPTKHERTETFYKRENFEEYYQKLVDAIENKFTEYNKALEEINSTKTANIFKKASIDGAKDKLQSEYFGNNEKEFIKNVLKYPEAEFVAFLDKDVKNKLINRLVDYYEQKFA